MFRSQHNGGARGKGREVRGKRFNRMCAEIMAVVGYSSKWPRHSRFSDALWDCARVTGNPSIIRVR